MPDPTQYADQYEETFVEVDGLRLHCTDWNPQGERTIVMLHGANVQLHTWDPIAADLAKDFRVVLQDLRGHGDSAWAPDGYHVQSFVKDLHGIVEELELAPFDLVGHSLGARVAIAYAGEHPDAVRHLLLSDTGPEVPREGALMARTIVGSTGDVRGFRTEEEALAHYEKLHPEWRPIFRELHVTHQLRRNWADKLVFKADPDLYWLTGSVGLKEIPYLWEMAARIPVPVMLLAGTTSPFVDQALAERFEATVPDGQVRWVESGHYIPREQPEQFVEITREFFDS